MTYSGDSSGLGPGQVRHPAILDAYIRHRGQQLAPRYAPDGQYQEPPPLGAAILHYCDLWDCNSDQVTADIIKESAGCQSLIYRLKWNPGGLGAENDDPVNKALDFRKPDADGNPTGDPADGVRCMAAHWANYFRGRGEWSQYDPRTSVLARLGYLGIAKKLSDLNGKWAYPGAGYGESIADGANGLLAFAATYEEPDVSLEQQFLEQVRAYGVEIHDIRDRLPRDGSYAFFTGTNPTHTAIHYTAAWRERDTLAKDIASWTGHARYHVQTQGWPEIAYTLGVSPSGRAFLLGELRKWRYNAFNDNPRIFPISHDITVGQAPTPEMLRTTAVLLQVLHTEMPAFPNLVRETTYGHQEFRLIGDPRNQTSCPGELLDDTQAYRAGNDFGFYLPPQETPIKPDLAVVDVPGIGERWVIGPIFRRWSEPKANIKVFGYPLTGAVDDAQGDTVQVFERARLRYRVGIYPDKWDVALDLVGIQRAVELGYLRLDPPQPWLEFDAGTQLVTNVHDAFKPAQTLPPATVEGIWFPEYGGHNLHSGFRAYWEKYGSLDYFGYPISEEFHENGRTVQYFERARFEHHPGVDPHHYDVVLGRVAAELIGL